MKLSYCLLLTLCLGGLSCGLSNVKPDPAMRKSAEEVVKRYQGKISYTYGVSESISKGKSKYVELTLEGSPLLNSSDEEYKTIAAGGIAYTFYKPLEKNVKFTGINIVIKDDTMEYKYPIQVKSLIRFDSLLKKFETVMDLYDSARFDQLVETIDGGEADSAKQQFITYLKDHQVENGPVTRKSPFFGFGAYEKNGRNRMVACYRVIREKNSHWLELYMDLSGNQPKITGVKHLK
ncbi:hypothetical protein [Pseudoflavitalea rhizosphaerae]|uniref:hypothetical protein n=1 Tax=Pseudoflavitalea rhizosphaerae TaxID=1884793 RepID=UPI000F8D9DA4|nr:hypothetical protein [Pseudoflavitalea rhizosphaerae]